MSNLLTALYNPSSWTCVHDACIRTHPLASAQRRANMQVSEGTKRKGTDMSTSSIIAMQKKDGSIEGIYCHWNGHPEGVGRILLDHYDAEKARELMGLGKLSSLGREIEAPDGAEHSFENPFPDVTVAYHRDRGERRVPNFIAASIAAFLREVPCIQYVYILKSGAWSVYLNNRNRAYDLREMLG